MAINFVSLSKFGPSILIINSAFRKISNDIIDNKNIIFKLIFCKISLALFPSIGVKTVTIELCSGPFIPLIIIMKNPGIMYA